MSKMSKMSGFPSIPQRISELINTKESLNLKKEEAYSAETQLAQASPNPYSIPSYLTAKIFYLEKRVEYLSGLQRALSELEQKGSISATEKRKIEHDIERVKLPLSGEALAIKLRERTIIEDMGDYMRSSSKPDTERAYVAAVTNTVDLRTGKQGKIRFGGFKRNALEFYGASKPTSGRDKETFCHLLGWKEAVVVRAAHIVPQSLDGESLVHLFGTELEPAKDPRNALCLSSRLEQALDCGDIVIAPIPGEDDAWKCVVTKSDGLNNTACHPYKWEDINGKRLTFLNEGRPRKRYLFFRYLVTYLRHMKVGNLKWAEDIDNEHRAWLSPGGYLRQSTLRILLQQATGMDLPETMFRMFDTTTDPAIDDLPVRVKGHREEGVSQLVATAVLNTYSRDEDEGEDYDNESDSDEDNGDESDAE